MAMSTLREPANALTHLVGSLLALAALIILVHRGLQTGDSRALVGLGIYGMSQLALYTASTLHHGLRLAPAAMERLLRLDCILVYVFIAGTYTPVCLIALQQGWRWGLLAGIWAAALGGLVLKVLWLHGPIWVSTMLYVAMGWIALVAIPALVQAVPRAGIGWFIAGGITYTAGALIFMLDRPWPRPGTFEAHAIWHLCVVGGSGCCFWAIIRYVVPLAG
jgi:hemolysin III